MPFDQFFLIMPVASLGLFALFTLAHKPLTEAAWFLSVSLPGLLMSFSVWRELINTIDVAGTLLVAAFFLPASWVFPTVIAVQIVRLARFGWRQMTTDSYWWFAGVVAQYVWTGLWVSFLNYK